MLHSTTAKLGAQIGLAAVRASVARHHHSFSVSDLYRICTLCKDPEDDVLGLTGDTAFMTALAIQYEAHAADGAAPINPFQDALLQKVLRPFTPASIASREAGAHVASPGDSSSAPGAAEIDAVRASTASSSPSCSLGEPTAQEHLNAIWEILADAKRDDTAVKADPGAHSVTADAAEDTHSPPTDKTYQVTRNTIQLIEGHVVALEKQLRQLSGVQVSHLIKALAVANYTNYHHTSLLSRRGCEVAAELPITDLCKLYFNLNKLNTQDSLQPIARRIQAHTQELSAEDVFLVAQALERQTNTSPVAATLVAQLAHQGAAQVVKARTPSYHRALLVALSRYNLPHHPAAQVLLSDLAQRSDKIHERDLLSILKAVCELGLVTSVSGSHKQSSSGDAIGALLQRAEQIVPSMDVRNIDVLMDVVSYLPVDSSAVMQAVMRRLDADAGKLTLPQVDFTLRLLSSYPPAHGDVCVVSLAFAASLRAEFMEAPALESILVSLATLHLFTDDFYTIAKVLQTEKGGFRQLRHLVAVVESYLATTSTKGSTGVQVASAEKPPVVDSRFVDLVHTGLLGLAPTLNDEELAHCRQLLGRLHIDNGDVQQRMLARARQLQRGGGARGQSRGTWGGGQRGSARGRGGGKRGYRDPMADLLE